MGTTALSPPTHALSPSFFRICRPQSHVLRYLLASRPCETPAHRRAQQPGAVPSSPPSFPALPHLHPSFDHVQRSVPEDTGCTRNNSKRPGDQWVHGLVGVVPYMWAGLQSEGDGKVKGPTLRTGEEHGLGTMQVGASGGRILAGEPKSVWRWGVGAADTPRYQLRREVMTKKRMAWLDPCFSTVAVRPWYVPFSPGGGKAWGLAPAGGWGRLHREVPRQEGEVSTHPFHPG